MPGTFSELFTTQLPNSDTNQQSKAMSTNITHTSAHAPMMPTTSPNFSETATPANKQFLATVLKLQAILSAAAEQYQIDQNLNETH